MCIGLCFRDSSSRLKGQNNKHSLGEQFWHLASTTSTVAPVRIGKTGVTIGVATKTSKTTTALWLVSKWNSMPLTMKCRIKNQKGRASPTQTWIALGKQLATYSLAASLLCTQSRFKIILHPARWWLSQRCDSCALAFALGIPAQRAK